MADQPPLLANTTVAITGSTSGIGREAASSLASDGATVLVLARDRRRGEELVVELRAGRGDAHFIKCELSSFASVRAAAAEISDRFERVDALVNNAGVIASSRILTEDGNELTFQVNHLSHFLLTNLLRPCLIAAHGRVVTVSSDAHFYTVGGIRFDDLNFEHGWSPFRAYAHSKLANVMFSYELADRWLGSGVTSNAMHPGVISSRLGSGGWGLSGWLWESLVPKGTPRRGADTLAWLALSPEAEGMNGLYFYRRRPKRSAPPTRRAAARGRLWETSARLTGLDQEGRIR